ncbi:nuclear exosome regulator NRDE2-like isoform X2 [Antedon mediterranea]|uniref:nuclear exosome regulator NRDE2-like isoform X2 n=1 Tax=Antedon mediterranea TaxID=105859 RepID=UPI003AF6E335
MFPSAINIQTINKVGLDEKESGKDEESSSWLVNESFPATSKDEESCEVYQSLGKSQSGAVQIPTTKRKKYKHHDERAIKQRKDSRHSQKNDRLRDGKKGHKKKKKHKLGSDEDYRKRERDGTRDDRQKSRSKHPVSHATSEKSTSSKYKDESSFSAMGCKCVWIEDLGPKALDACCIDTKADKNNLCFESVHFSDAAFYKRLESSCLGLDHKQEINWYSHKQSKKSKKQKIDDDRYYSKKSMKVLTNEEDLVDFSGIGRNKKCLIENEKLSTDTFIPLENNADVENSESEIGFNRDEVDPLNIHDKATQYYLFGQTPHAVNDSKEDNKEPMRFDSWEGLITKQTEEYNKKLRENPNDVKLWMQFVKFQDEIALRGHSIYFSGETDDKRRKLSRLVLEKKIAILERAIVTNTSSLELKLEHVELCMEIWNSKELKEHWDKMIFQHPNDPLLWNAYLMFVQSQFSTFTFNKVLSVYGKCIGKLATIMEGQMSTHKPLPNTDLHLLGIFCQLCEVIRQSGYTEKAVCCYQAMIEFNLFGSHKLDATTPHNEQSAFLEIFWDSEEPKFGEKGANGWNSWMKMKQKGGWKQLPSSTVSEVDEEIENDKIPESCVDTWQSWVYLETAREQRHFLPWKPDPDKDVTEDDCEDPERMVVFDDVSAFLFKIKSEELQYKLLLNFLRFLGVTVPTFGSSNDYEVCRHSMYALQHTDQIFFKSNYSLTDPINYDYKQLSVGVTSNCSQLGVGTTSESSQLTPPRIIGSFKQFVRNVLAQSLQLFTSNKRTTLLLIWIKFEYEQFDNGSINDDKSKKKAFKQHCKDVRKFAKCILKEEVNRNNLLLWEVYAKLEWKLGNVEEARRVIGTALGMSGQVMSGQEVRNSIPSLVASYTYLELDLDANVRSFITNKKEKMNNDGIDRLLKVLTWLGQGSEVFSNPESDETSALDILKARRGFQTNLDAKMETYKSALLSSEESDDLEYFLEYVCCYAWFQYITVGLQAATVVFEESLSFLKTHSAKKREFNDTYIDSFTTTLQKHYEDIFLNYIKLVIYHILRNPTPLTMIRSILQRALLAFPRSAVFLQLFISLEMKSLIIGRVRRYFDGSLQSSVSPVVWLYSIQAEMTRDDMLAKSRQELDTAISDINTGITHRIRSLFMKAVSDQATRHSVLIWRMFIQFEACRGDMKKAKSLFFRAIQCCPWAKVLYLDAVRYFPDELQNILDILMEKDLHIRVPIEEVELLMKVESSNK